MVTQMVSLIVESAEAILVPGTHSLANPLLLVYTTHVHHILETTYAGV